MKLPWKVSLVLLCVGLLLSSGAFAYKLTGYDWSYQPNPMGQDWHVCPSGMPGSGVQRTKDGAFAWNYSKFTFTFGTDACLSGGAYPSSNGVNQVDFGGGLGPAVLAQTSWFFDPTTGDTLECDMRFNSAFNWYTGTGTPLSGQIDLQSVATHEMGHCLGLAHEDGVTPPPVMSSRIAFGEVRRDLTEDDIAGRDAIYGPSSGTHTLTIISGPSGTPNPVASGGTATLSVTAVDSQGHSLGYGWTALCPVALGSNGSFSNPNVQNPTWTAPINTTGSQQNCTIGMTVSDGQGLSQLGSYSQGVISQASSCLYAGTVVRVTAMPGASPSTIYVRPSALNPVFFSGTTSDAKLLNAALHALPRQIPVIVGSTAATCPAVTAGSDIGPLNLIIVNP